MFQMACLFQAPVYSMTDFALPVSLWLPPCSHVSCLCPFSWPVDCSGIPCCSRWRTKLKRTLATPSTPCSATFTGARRTAWTGTVMTNLRWGGAPSLLLSVLGPRVCLRWEGSPHQWVVCLSILCSSCHMIICGKKNWAPKRLLLSDLGDWSVCLVDEMFSTDGLSPVDNFWLPQKPFVHFCNRNCPPCARCKRLISIGGKDRHGPNPHGNGGRQTLLITKVTGSTINARKEGSLEWVEWVGPTRVSRRDRKGAQGRCPSSGAFK